MSLNKRIVSKLASKNISIDPKITAVMAFICNEAWTEPSITAMALTSDGFLLAQRSGEIGLNCFIGAANDINTTIGKIIASISLSPKEVAIFWQEYDSKIRQY